jgi:hypothetical protein
VVLLVLAAPLAADAPQTGPRSAMLSNGTCTMSPPGSARAASSACVA